MRYVTLKRLAIWGLLVTAVVCAYIGMELSRDCEQRGTTHETAQWFLAIVGGLAVGLATAAGVRIHWILRVIVALAVTMLAIGALIIFDWLAWLGECD
jgi:hypothetical protein